MSKTFIFTVVSLVVALVSQSNGQSFGQDVYMTGQVSTTGDAEGSRVLMFEDGFSMSIGDNDLSSAKAVVSVRPIISENLGITTRQYQLRAYLEGDVDITGGNKSRAVRVKQKLVERGHSLVVSFIVPGNVYLTGEKSEALDIDTNLLYNRARDIFGVESLNVKISPKARIPGIIPPVSLAASEEDKQAPEDSSALSMIIPTRIAERQGGSFEEKSDERPKYPVNIAALWKPSPKLERSVSSDGVNVVTIEGRFYIWQKINEKGDIIEFQADNAVVFYSDKELKVGSEETGRADLLAGGDIDSVYIEGDIIMTERGRTIKADRMYYDFNTRRALAENVQMRHFSEQRAIPIYLRAQRLLSLNERIYAGEDIVLTSDEFYIPQLSAQASSIIITDNENLDARDEKTPRYEARMSDVRLKHYDTTLLKMSSYVGSAELPELPIKSVRVGQQTALGAFAETRWYLARVLGYSEPADTESTLSLDYYGKRGFGTGAAFEYQTQDYFGSIDSYIIKDHGQDRLGSAYWRKDLEPERDIRGRLAMVHREYLPDDWQLTFEFSYLSDRNFLESFYRDEYYTGKEQETLVHLKRSTDNWAVSWLAKARINDFEDYLEEIPSFEFHLTGQDLFDGRLTYYSDTQIARMRNRFDDGLLWTPSEDFFTYSYTRHEIDMPLAFGNVKYVPYVAGSYAYDDGENYYTRLDGSGGGPDKDVVLGEAGLRASTLFWRTDQFANNQLWDINGIRHYLRPHLELAMYEPSDSTIDMRDMINIGIDQVWQTRRGEGDNLKTVDWMRLDLNTTFVSDSEKDPTGTAPSGFIFNNPAVPFFNRRYSQTYGIERNTFEADHSWIISDTFATKSYLNADMQSGVVQQFNVGFSRYCWPSVSYYLGSRYLKRYEITYPDATERKGSHAVDFAVTYEINPRYTLAYAQEYNFDYAKNVDSEVTLIRKYKRLLYGLTYRADASLDSKSVVLSVWPQGVRELAIGSRSYIGLPGSSAIYK